MSEKITIKSIEEKSGVSSKTGKKFIKYNIVSEEYGNVSAFKENWNRNWDAGMIVDVDVARVNRGDVTYINLNLPTEEREKLQEVYKEKSDERAYAKLDVILSEIQENNKLLKELVLILKSETIIDEEFLS